MALFVNYFRSRTPLAKTRGLILAFYRQTSPRKRILKWCRSGEKCYPCVGPNPGQLQVEIPMGNLFFIEYEKGFS
jgi:hypothetical protein